MTKRADIRTVRRTNVSEADIQASFFNWCTRTSHIIPELALFYAIPNGQRRTRWEAAQHKRTGMQKGVLDVHLPVARQNYHGLWLEFKSETGRVSPEQRRWINDLRAAGHRVEVVRSAEEAQKVTLDYLGV